MPRLFTAIELPAEIREGLARLRQPLPGAKWIEPGDLHITLRFAGDLDNRAAEEFSRSLGDVACSMFELRINGLGAFGGNDPRTLWAGVANSEELKALAHAHERAARASGLPPEPRKFKPHVTLARLRNTPVDLVARFLQRHGGFRSPPFSIRQFALLSSKPKLGGGPYVTEAEYPLAGAQFEEEAERW
jgi:RNA 2',3'-cyclic 3'-phosphodiesterase